MKKLLGSAILGLPSLSLAASFPPSISMFTEFLSADNSYSKLIGTESDLKESGLWGIGCKDAMSTFIDPSVELRLINRCVQQGVSKKSCVVALEHLHISQYNFCYKYDDEIRHNFQQKNIEIILEETGKSILSDALTSCLLSGGKSCRPSAWDIVGPFYENFQLLPERIPIKYNVPIFTQCAYQNLWPRMSIPMKFRGCD